MNLTKKLKPLAAGLMLSAASLGMFGGCATTTPWQRDRIVSRETGVEREVTRDAGDKTVRERTLEISENYIEDEAYKTNITESLRHIMMSIEGKKKVKTFDEIAIEERENSSFFQTKKERRENKIGTREEYSKEKFTATFLREEEIYKNQPGKEVKFGIVGKDILHQTDAGGVISWGISKPYVFVSREGLEKRLEELPLVKEIKLETRERLREKLLEAIYSYSEQVTIETRESPADNLEMVRNAKKTLNFDYYTLKNEDIYNIVHQFVDEEINPSIKTLKLNVKDDLTHVPISGSNFEFTTDSPSKAELLDKYFEGKLKADVENFVSDYLHGSPLLKNCSEKLELPVYSPSNIFLEVTHPEYNFVDGEIGIDGDMEKTVYMVDKGSKVRLQNVEESIGRIE